MNNFAPLDDLAQLEELAANTRVFVGGGTPFLPAPGLLKVAALRIGTVVMPLQLTRSYPVGAGGRHLSEVHEPLFELQHRADGTPVLIRSTLSNNGVWQDGANIYISGDWAAAEEDVPTRKKAEGKRQK